MSRPASDQITAGWTPSAGAVLYDMIDEASASDADYITSPLLEYPAGPAQFSLTEPIPDDNCVVQIRARRTESAGQVRARLIDAQGAAVGVSAWQSLTADFQTYDLALTTTGTATALRIDARRDVTQEFPDGLLMLGNQAVYLDTDYVSLA